MISFADFEGTVAVLSSRKSTRLRVDARGSKSDRKIRRSAAALCDEDSRSALSRFVAFGRLLCQGEALVPD